MSSDNLRLIDSRIRMALKGTEVQRGVVVGVSVWTGPLWLTVLSPVFVAILLMKVSGVPLLEARADARFADDADYLSYKARTPVLLPRRPRAEHLAATLRQHP